MNKNMEGIEGFFDGRSDEENERIKNTLRIAFPPPREAQAANGAGDDPVFAAIGEHKARVRESRRLEKSCKTARAKAEEKHGEWIAYTRRNGPNADWPGYAIVSPFYARWNCAGRAESKEAKRMAMTEPATLAGAAATIDHIRRETAGASTIEDWVPTALKTAVAALSRLEASRAWLSGGDKARIGTLSG